MNPDLASVAALIADPSRATMLTALLGGRAFTAGELARVANISPQTASSHLAKLVEGKLLSLVCSGRHRYYQLYSKEVAQVLESLALIAPPQRTHSLKQGLEVKSLCQARTCYDHLAGLLGVRLAEALVDNGILQRFDEAFEVTAQGSEWFLKLGIRCEEIEKKWRRFASVCIDWSERKPHVGGALGAAIAQRMFAVKWIVQHANSRAVRVTDAGYVMLEQTLGIARESIAPIL